jgi:signal transduction histidine kinase
MSGLPAGRAPAWRLGLAIAAGWLLGVTVAAFTAVGRSLPARLPGVAIWTLLALSVAFAVVAARRELIRARRTARLIARALDDRHRLEGELQRAERMEAVGQLAGGMAHDFNNLLTLITGYSDLLRRRVGPDHHSVELVNGVQGAVTRAAVLTGQLLTASGPQPALPVVLSPAETLRSASEVLERVLGAGIELSWALDLGAGQVRIDPRQMEQVVLNLAVNARDAMPGGGRLDVAVSAVQLDRAFADELEIPAGRYVRVSVADNGTGMDANTRQHCLEPMFTTKGVAHGSGLGLAAVNEVARAAGGAVGVETVPGQGSTFVVYLPAV